MIGCLQRKALIVLILAALVIPAAGAQCATPVDDLHLLSDTIFCGGNGTSFALDDAGDNGTIVIAADNIALNCNNTIIYGNVSQSDAGIGINLTGRTNITVVNCTFWNYTYPLVLARTQGSTVSFSSFTAGASGDIPIYLDDADSNTLMNLTVLSISDDGLYLTGSDRNTLSGLVVNTSPAGSAAIYMYNSTNNTIKESRLTTAASGGSGANGVRMDTGSARNSLLNLTINTTSSGQHAVYLYESPGTIIRYLNASTTRGGSAIYLPYGMSSGGIHQDIDSSSLAEGKPIYYTNDTSLNNGALLANTAAYGQIIVAGLSNITLTNITMSGADGILLSYASNVTLRASSISAAANGLETTNTQDSEFSGTLISTVWGQPSLWTYGSTGNFFVNLSLSPSGSYGYGMYLLTGTDNNVFENISVNTSGFAGTGIYVFGSDGNVFRSIRVNATGSDGLAFYIAASDGNTLQDSLLESFLTGSVSALDIWMSNHNRITNVSVINRKSDAAAVQLSSATNNTLTGLNITSLIAGAHGLAFTSATSGNLARGLTITTRNASTYGIFFDGAGAAVQNNTVRDSVINASSAAAVRSENDGGALDFNFLSNLSIGDASTNLSFNDSNSSLYWQWALDVYVNDSSGAAVVGAIVNATQANGALVFSGVTDGTGWARSINLTEYLANFSGRIFGAYNNHTISVTSGVGSGSREVNITGAASTVITVSDGISPAWSSPVNVTPCCYNGTSQLRFNISWTDDSEVDVVLIEVNRSGVYANYTASNTSGNGIYNLTLIQFPAGTHMWRSHANDTVGNGNSTPWYPFTIAKTGGGVALTLNGTSGPVTIDEDTAIWLNGTRVAGDEETVLYLYVAEVGLGDVEYDQGITVANLSTFSNPGTFQVRVNLTATQNYTSAQAAYAIIVNDITSPAWSNARNVTPASFNPAGTLVFNITWADSNVSRVQIELNRSGIYTNYTASYNGSSVYNLTLTDFPAGTHTWRSHANDTSGNRNTSSWFPFSIAKIAPTLSLSLSGIAGPVTINEDMAIWLNGSLTTGDSGTTLVLSKDGVEQDQGASVANLSTFFTPGTFNISLNYTATQNYSSALASYFVTAIDITSPTWSAEVNVTPATYSAAAQLTFNITWLDNVQVDVVLIELNRSGVYANYTASNASGNGIYNLTLAGFPAGTHSWRSYANDTSGNKNTSASFLFTIAKATPAVQLTLNQTVNANVTIDEDTSIWLNGTLGIGDVGASIALYLDGALLQNASSPANLSTFSSPGIFNVTLSYFGSQNYSTNGTTSFVKVNAQTPPLLNQSSMTSITPAEFFPGTVSFNLTWTDDVEVDVVLIELNRSGVYTNYTASNFSGNGVYNLTLPTFPAGSHGWRSHANDTSGNRNSTAWVEFTIAKASAILNLTINNSVSNHTTGENSTFTVNASILTGDAAGFIELYLNGSLLRNGTSSNNLTSLPSRSTRNVSLIYRATQNYSETLSWLNIAVQDQVAPVISSVSSTVTESTATIAWSTDKASDSEATAGTKTASSASLETSHTLQLTGLTAGTQYTANIESCNADAFCDTDSVTFTTTSGGGGSSGGESAPAPPSSSTFISVIEAGVAEIVKIADETIGLQEIHITVENPAQNVEIMVIKLEDAPASVAQSITDSSAAGAGGAMVYHYLDISVKRLDRENLKSAQLQFRVERDWLADNGLSEDQVGLFRYADAWEALPTTFTGRDATYANYEAETPGFSVFAIAARVAVAQAAPAPEEVPIAELVPETVEEPTGQSPEPSLPVTQPVRRSLWRIILSLLAVCTLLAAGFGYLRTRRTPSGDIESIEKRLKRRR